MFNRSREIREALREANCALRSRNEAFDRTTDYTLAMVFLVTVAAALYLGRF
jgi:hypothetical protein